MGLRAVPSSASRSQWYRWRSAERCCTWHSGRLRSGTSYAVWTGIGAAGTFLIGVWFFGDPNTLGRWFGAALIVAGVATLKLAH